MLNWWGAGAQLQGVAAGEPSNASQSLDTGPDPRPTNSCGDRPWLSVCTLAAAGSCDGHTNGSGGW